MTKEVESLIRRIVREELGMYDTGGRRTENHIRDLLQRELRLRPKTRSELVNAISADKSTVQNHLTHLKDLDIVSSFELDGVTYWRLENR